MNEDQEEEWESLGYVFLEGECTLVQIGSASEPHSFIVKIQPDNIEEEEITSEDIRPWLLLRISWPVAYPAVALTVDLESDEQNKILTPSQRAKVMHAVTETLVELEGEMATLSVVSAVKDILEDMKAQLLTAQGSLWINSDAKEESAELAEAETKKEPTISEPKLNLTKRQKNQLLKTTGIGGKRQRGWDWVDIQSHLSKI